jgi:hypothetical protein
MLIYHPAFDAYHCIFRILKLLAAKNEIEYPAIRILDFLMVFPHELSDITLPKGSAQIKKAARDNKNPYRGPVNRLQMFRGMEQLQLTAVNALSAAEMIDAKALSDGVVRLKLEKIPEHLLAQLESFDDETEKYIVAELTNIPLRGNNGLKQRTGLLEYKYDPA